jgi:hypothetical protein
VSPHHQLPDQRSGLGVRGVWETRILWDWATAMFVVVRTAAPAASPRFVGRGLLGAARAPGLVALGNCPHGGGCVPRSADEAGEIAMPGRKCHPDTHRPTRAEQTNARGASDWVLIVAAVWGGAPGVGPLQAHAGRWPSGWHSGGVGPCHTGRRACRVRVLDDLFQGIPPADPRQNGRSWYRSAVLATDLYQDLLLLPDEPPSRAAASGSRAGHRDSRILCPGIDRLGSVHNGPAAGSFLPNRPFPGPLAQALR